ncbi:MAG: right-handed parallel beta-helix repeat-containing protein [Bacteroidales bacterium]|jgi:polygalacturonase|nr:right-handed parallel beta-helix repeat-containing protein [Bacteroidales bacterium]
MNKIKIVWLLSFFCLVQVSAKDYNASLFGIKSNGTTLNTTSIQKAIDYISENGGGTLQFYVGRYLTGSIFLKSNVTINLNEGAILLGSTNPYDYRNFNDKIHTFSFVSAYQAENIGITGKGVIDGQGREMVYNFLDQQHKGIMPDLMRYDRPGLRPNGVYLRECKNVTVTGVTIKSAGGWTFYPDQCENMLIDGVTVLGLDFWNNDGIDIVDCKNLKLLNSFIDAADDAICFKSHEANKYCENVEVRNCVARSSASAIKFGTVTAGGYKHIRIINNKVYNTHRSAITIAVPDGGFVDDVLVDSLYAYNTSNAIYLRIGARNTSRPPGTLKNITIQNMYCEIPATKADVNYPYEGPVEDNPRNISPASIVGLAGGYDIENVTLRNIELVYPGGGNVHYAYRGLKPADLDSIPEMARSYPEFSQFLELPAWAFWVRHAKNVTFENITLTAKERDYRPAIVIQETENVTLKNMLYKEPGGKKKQVHTYKTKNIVQK